MQIAACATTDAIIIKAATPHPTGAPTQVLDLGFVDTLGGGGENAGVLTIIPSEGGENAGVLTIIPSEGGENAGVLTTIPSEGGENTEVVASKGRGQELISTNVLSKNCTSATSISGFVNSRK